MKPLLAHVYEPHRVTYPCYVQPKLNGIRALYQNGHFQSRDEIPFPNGLLDHLAKSLQSIFDPSVILDGELYKHGWPLQRINGAVTPIRQEPNEDTKEIEYHVFDQVNFNFPFAREGNTLGSWETFEQVSAYNKVRYAALHFIISKQLAQIHAVETRLVDNEQEANKLYSQFVSFGYEGMMYRLGDCPYTIPKQKNAGPFWTLPKPEVKFLSDQDNRVWHLLKRKSWQDDEFQCIGIEEGEGKYKGMVGALICQPRYDHAGFGSPYDKGYVREHKRFKVSSGLTDSQRMLYFEQPNLLITCLIKVKYLCLSSDGIPLNPTILAIL